MSHTHNLRLFVGYKFGKCPQNNDMKDKSFLKGAFVLAIGGIICKVLGAFYRVPLASILGDVGMGVYQLIYPVYAFSIVFVTSGLTGALTYVVSRNKKTYNYKNLKKFFWSSLLFSGIICLFVGLSFVLLSNYLAGLLGNVDAGLGFVVAGVSATLAGVISTFRGWFQGFEDMVPTAISQVLEQVLKVGLGIWLAVRLMPFGVSYAVSGAFLGVLAGEVFAAIYLWIGFSVSKKHYVEFSKSRKKLGFWEATKKLGSKWFAFGLTGFIIPLTVAVDSFLVVNLLKRAGFGENVSTALFGIQSGMINSLINFPMILAISLSTSIIPSISFLVKQKKMGEVKDKINQSLRLVLFFSVPCALGMMTISHNILYLFYPKLTPAMHDVAVVLLLISAFNVVYLGLLQITSSILQALGHVYIPIFSTGVGCLFKIALTLILVPNPNINIYGSAIAGVFSYLVPCVINIFALRRDVKINVGAKFAFALVVASVSMAGATFAINSLIFSSSGIILTTFVCLVFAILSYFLMMFGFSDIKMSELGKTKKV